MSVFMVKMMVKIHFPSGENEWHFYFRNPTVALLSRKKKDLCITTHNNSLKFHKTIKSCQLRKHH